MDFEAECRLGAVADLVRGVAYKPSSLLDSSQEGAVPLLRATNIGAQTLELRDVLYVPRDLVKGAQYLHRHDVVIAMSSGSRAAVGRLAQLRQDWFGTFGAFCGAIRPIPDKVDAEFLGYILYSPDFRARIEMYAAGTAIMNLTREHLLGFPVKLPKRPYQRTIAHLLGSIDDRIALLRQTNATLESIAQALFKSWFVDFDPVRAKAEGREPEGMDAATAALFPAEFEESELGAIPKGWIAGRLGDVCTNPRAQAKPAEVPNETPYIGLEHMPRRSLALTSAGTAEGLESGKFWFERDDVLFGKLRPYFHKVGLAPRRGICSTDILVLRPVLKEWLGFVTMHASSDALVSYASQLSNGARMPRTSWHDVSRFPVAVPPRSVADAFNHAAVPLFERIYANIATIDVLAKTRDALLPPLISGKLRLPEAEAQIDEAIA